MPALRNPITGTAGCCALAASGDAADAPPSSVMNSRQLKTAVPGTRGILSLRRPALLAASLKLFQL